MDRSADSYERIMKLLSLQADGLLDDQQWGELAALLAESEEMRDIYVEHMFVHTLMHEVAKLDNGPLPAPDGSALSTNLLSDEQPRPGETLWTRGQDLFGDAFRAGIDFFSHPFVLTLLLAVGLPSVMLLILVVNMGRQAANTAPPARPASVAKVMRTHECKWEERADGVSQGQWLSAGQQLRLQRGLVEVRFADGARVILEGPATFDLLNARQGFLRVGNLAANVPVGAEGFAINTPSASIVDLGTDFGVSVRADGTAETHVFQGEVEVTANGPSTDAPPKMRRLQAGEAVKVKRAGADRAPQFTDMAAQPLRFARCVPDSLPKPTIIFTHHGGADPTTEGWRPHSGGGDKNRYKVAPVNENGKSAWSMRAPEGSAPIYYAIGDNDGLTPKLLAEATKKGWVLRTRVWVNPQMPSVVGPWTGLYLCSYRDDDSFGGSVIVSLDHEGNQLLRTTSPEGDALTIPIPGSRGRYVDYEVRYSPGAKHTEMWVNGRCIAKPRLNEGPDSFATIRFGMFRSVPSDVRCNLVEWGILRDAPKKETSKKKP